MRKYCYYCRKEIDSLIPFKCRHCGQLFCKDHYLPENHKCTDFKPRPWIKPIYSSPVEPKLPIEPETPSKPEPLPEPEPKPEPISKPIQEPEPKKIGDTKHKSNYYLYKLKKWFFRKKHPRSRLRINDFIIHLSVIIGLSFLFWLTHTNSDNLNNIELWIFRLGAIIQIILIIFILRSAYKLLINLKYGIRGLGNGYKVIGSIIAFLFCAYFILNANVMVSYVTDFDYDTFNPFEITWNPSNQISDYDTTIDDDYNDNGNQDVTTQPEININELESEIHVLINNERQNYGLSPLQYDSKLADIARDHSQDMAARNYFDHNNPEGQGPTERAIAAGYTVYKDLGGGWYSEGIAENIFQNWLYDSITYINGIPSYDWSTQSEIASSTVSGWMNSPGHRSNILESSYEKEGIGVAISSDYKVLITQDFW